MNYEKIDVSVLRYSDYQRRLIDQAKQFGETHSLDCRVPRIEFGVLAMARAILRRERAKQAHWFESDF